jgi:uncharacterized protein
MVSMGLQKMLLFIVMMKLLKFIIRIPDYIAMGLIRVYQKTLSTDHSFWARPDIYRICIYHPSCSEYTYDAIDKFGIIRGSIMGTARIIRCNPLSTPGDDPVPDHFSLKRNHNQK